MNIELVSLTIQSMVSLLMILWLLGQYRRYRVDAFRQSLFEVRDQLFDYAADGHIDYNHPAYGMLRSTINGFIRFGHQVSLIEILLFVVITRKSDKSETINLFATRWKKALSGLDENVQRELIGFLFLVHYKVAIYSLGYIVNIILFLAKTIHVASHCRQKMKGFLQSVSDKLDTTAHACGG